ncbi:Rhodanese-like domain-containing protein 4-chloroplastic [Striga hermonthica]|uniref:Rhodanese-like domain-containing protein 4-chloroplastic n=1 Tax=Striga hermonthica TaxID=68872 RepID=A0A9N7MUW5_STRHE|nr:Rhodanese-like domain-containing protein 4-chloroplastic [Striga hermonthica]
MEALKAPGLTPLSVLAQKTEPKKNPLSLATISPLKLQPFSVSKPLHGSLIILSSFLSSELAKALTYDEALEQSIRSSASDFDINSFIGFASENPIILGGGAAVVAVPVVVSRLLSKPKRWGVESAKAAYMKLGDDGSAQLLDIRATAEIKQTGSPEIRGLKKKPVAVVYKAEEKPGFLKKLSLKFKEPEKTTLFILDKFDGNSELVAELVTENGFKAAYAIKDGAEGPRGWLKSDLPWILPKKTLSFDLSNFTDAFGEAAEIVPSTLGVAAAAAGLGLLAFTEVETILQILGSAALVQFASKKLLFAEDRKRTLQQIEELLNTKVGPKEFVDDIQKIGKALLPSPVISNALPAAPGETTPMLGPAETAVLKSKTESVPTEAKTTLQVNSVPEAEIEQESLPAPPARPLSPYPKYPDYKPPSSPSPSQP